MMNSSQILKAALIGFSFSVQLHADVIHVFNPTPETGSYDLIDDFENGVSDWSSTGAHAGFFWFTDQPFEGSYAAQTRTRVISNGGGYAAERIVNFEANTDYVLSAFFWTEELPTGQLRFEFRNSFGQSQPPFLNALIDQEGWVFSYTIFNSGTDTSATLRMIRGGTRSSNDNGLIDNVALTKLSDFVPASSVPEPTTLPMLILGLVFVSRRRDRASSKQG